MILDQIVHYKKKHISQEKEAIPYQKVIKQLIAQEATGFKNIKDVLKKSTGLSIIAEVKKASPSKGIIREEFDPVNIALEYEANQVDAISVLTEKDFFLGKDQYVRDIKKRISTPILRKDFIIDPYQICQSKLLGADMILLIVAILSAKELDEYLTIARGLRLASLVEVHNEQELETALKAGAEIIGINNRNLNTFQTTLKTTERLISQIPRDKVVISESGIRDVEDMKYLRSLGVDGVLIGESLMRASSITNKLQELQVGLNG